MTVRRRAISFVNGDRAASDVRHTGPHAPERILRARMKTARFITILKALAAAAILIFAAVPLRGQGMASEPLKTTLEARKVVRGADGRESFVPADVARPGDVIEYVATYRNTTREALKNLEATLPIPEHTELVPGSTRPASVRAARNARLRSARIRRGATRSSLPSSIRRPTPRFTTSTSMPQPARWAVAT